MITSQTAADSRSEAGISPRSTEGMGWRRGVSIITFFGLLISLVVWLFFYATEFRHLSEHRGLRCYLHGVHWSNGCYMGLVGNAPKRVMAAKKIGKQREHAIPSLSLFTIILSLDLVRDAEGDHRNPGGEEIDYAGAAALLVRRFPMSKPICSKVSSAPSSRGPSVLSTMAD